VTDAATALPEAPSTPDAAESQPPKAGRSRRGRTVPAPAPDPSAEVVESIEAVLLSSDRPIPDARIAAVLELPEEPAPASVIEVAVDRLNADFERTGRVFRIRRVAGGWRVLIQPRHADVLERLKGQRNQAKLTPAALETLAIIAYRQPIVRAQIEAIRGVACGEVLRGLLDRRLVRIVGRAEELGRPMLYGTTKEFLAIFGLASLSDLPQRREFGDSPAGSSPGKRREDVGASPDQSTPRD